MKTPSSVDQDELILIDLEQQEICGLYQIPVRMLFGPSAIYDPRKAFRALGFFSYQG